MPFGDACTSPVGPAALGLPHAEVGAAHARIADVGLRNGVPALGIPNSALRILDGPPPLARGGVGMAYLGGGKSAGNAEGQIA